MFGVFHGILVFDWQCTKQSSTVDLDVSGSEKHEEITQTLDTVMIITMVPNKYKLITVLCQLKYSFTSHAAYSQTENIHVVLMWFSKHI